MLGILKKLHGRYDQLSETGQFYTQILLLAVPSTFIGAGIFLGDIWVVIAGMVSLALILGSRVWYVEFS